MQVKNVSPTRVNECKAHLNHQEWNIATGNARNGNLTPLEPKIANDLFSFFCLGRSLKDIAELTNHEYKWIIATAIEYDWFARKSHTHQDTAVVDMAKDLANNLFLMNMKIVNDEIAKVMTDPTYKPTIGCITNLKDFRELLVLTMQANNIQNMLSQSNIKTLIANTNNVSTGDGKGQLNASGVIEAEIDTNNDEERMKMLEKIIENKKT